MKRILFKSVSIILWIVLMGGASAAFGIEKFGPNDALLRIVYSGGLEGYIEPCG